MVSPIVEMAVKSAVHPSMHRVPKTLIAASPTIDASKVQTATRSSPLAAGPMPLAHPVSIVAVRANRILGFATVKINAVAPTHVLRLTFHPVVLDGFAARPANVSRLPLASRWAATVGLRLMIAADGLVSPIVEISIDASCAFRLTVCRRQCVLPTK